MPLLLPLTAVAFLVLLLLPPALLLLLPLSAARGYHVVAQTKPKSPIGMSSGLLVASRYPIGHVQFHMFTEASGDDALAKKGVLIAELVAGGRRGVVACTHLQASGGHAIKRQQIQDAARWVQAFVVAQGGLDYAFVLLAGDLNSPPQSPTGALWPFTMPPAAPFRVLTLFGPEVPSTTLDTRAPVFLRHPPVRDTVLQAKPCEGPIDHVLTLRGPQFAGLGAAFAPGVPYGRGGVASDHMCVVARVTLGRGPVPGSQPPLPIAAQGLPPAWYGPVLPLTPTCTPLPYPSFT